MTDSEHIDTLYQQAVDSMAQNALSYSKDEVLGLPDDEIITVAIAGQQVNGWIRHVKWSDGLHHVVFSLTRKTWLVMYKLYLAGIKLESDGRILLLTNEEIVDYD